MMSFIDNVLNQISYEKHSIGEIIDDRSMNHIPLHAYAVEYAKLEAVEKMIKNAFNKHDQSAVLLLLGKE